jgi:hypothetical protein
MQQRDAAGHSGRGDSAVDRSGPSRFLTWELATLAQFAHEVNEQNKQLREDLKVAMAAYRELLRRQ